MSTLAGHALDWGHHVNEGFFALAAEAVDAALAAGATYADARVVNDRHRSLAAQNGRMESVDESETLGLGIRALVGSSWGFASTSDLADDAVRRAGATATATAKASTRLPGPPLELADVPVSQTHWENPVVEEPFEVSIAEQADLVVGLTTAMHGVGGVAIATATVRFWETRSWFVSSQGHRISQRIVKSGGGMSATAIGEGESQIRSYPQSFGQYETGGYEVVRGFDLPGNAERVATEATALLEADPCPAGTMDIILGGSQVALQIHESVGHAIELDRILGWEAAFAGTSFLELENLGSMRYGSDLMNITADATIPGSLGTFGFDDEGTPAKRVDIVTEGTWVGVLSGRDSAHIAGLEPGGMVRSSGFNRLPMVRMTNVGLLPGDTTLDEIIAETRHGIFMDVNRSWSIDDRRLNFQFGCEMGWEIKDGKLHRMVRNPTYTGITPQFWASMDRLAGGDDWMSWGTPNCGKGQPIQIAHTGHPAAPARFRDVRVGVTG
jgi:TldD protein